ncbi:MULTISPECIES: GNAT family N-acetyltransferase [Micrococcales]|uniref:GNAT family N-acetyltransferase n=1 Tax=Micrococcales TaxID=85006 RepID=UPI0004AA0373|nr:MULTISPECIES: GNAT family N-acetyltransferase [Micrococcales]
MTLKPIHITEFLGKDGKATEDYRRMMARIAHGFHQDPGAADVQDYRARRDQAAGFVLRGFEDTTDLPEWAGSGPKPVATILGFPLRINAGKDVIDLWGISGVGVAPTHRRQGLLRSMMHSELETAQRNGFPLAGLTATEGGIYGRFGFGISSRQCTYEVNLRAKPRILTEVLEATGADGGSIVEAEPRGLLELARDLNRRRVEIIPGQISRLTSTMEDGLGIVSLDKESLDPRRACEAFVYRGPRGVDGYAVIEHEGWDKESSRVKVVDFQVATTAAWAGLWDHLFQLDLIDYLTFEGAPGQPLGNLVRNPRDVRLTKDVDLIWTRILDVKTVLESRSYPTDGELVLLIDDPVELVTGAYALRVTDGVGTVTASEYLPESGRRGTQSEDDAELAPGAPRVRLSVDRLASAAFRGCHVEARFGVLRGEGVLQATRLFSVDDEPYCDFDF